MAPIPPPATLGFMELVKNVIGFSHTEYTVTMTVHKGVFIAIFLAIAFGYIIKNWRKKEI